MDVHGVNRGFLGLLLTFFILGFPAELHAEEIAGEGDLRHKSSTQIFLRRLRGTDLENPGDRFDEDYNIWLQSEHLKTASVLQQLGGTDIENNLQLFLDERAGVNIVKQIQNTGSSFEHNLRKILNNQPPRTNSFLHGSLYRHRALAPFVSSVVIPTYDDDAEFVRPASGEDQNSNLPWPLEGLRALLDLHSDEKRLLLSPLGTPAISPVPAIAPSPLVQNNHDKVPVPSPEILSPNFGPSPLTGVVVQPDQNLFIPPPEQLKKSGNSKTVILAVVITAISTLLLSGLFFYFYQRCFSNRHGSNYHNDQRPLLIPSVHSESLNQYYGEPQGFNWATFENSNGFSPKSAFLETGKADGKQLSSFNRRNLRVLSLPSRLRKSTEALDIHPFPPLPKTKPSLELCDKGAFNSSTSKTRVASTQPLPESLQAPSSIPAPLSVNSSVPVHAWNKTPSQPTDVSLPRHSQSSHPLSLSSKLPPFLSQPNSFVRPPVNSTPPSPPVSSSPTPPSLSKPTPPPPPPTGKSPPPPPPPPGKSPPPPPPPIGKSPPPPPPPIGKSPPLAPPAPSNGKYNGPKVPLPPGRTSQIPPPMPLRSKGQPEHSNVVGEDGNQQPKLKPFHWDKVQANPDHSMVWDQIRAGSFQFNEEMIETLFGYNSSNTATSRMAKQANNPSQNKQLLDPKKSHNLAILLKAMNLRREDVCDALLNGESLSVELLETLIKMAPTRDEEKKLKEYNDDISKLGPAERFLKALLEIPSAFERMDKMLYRKNFKDEIRYIRKSFEALEAACKDLRSSRLFLKLLEAVLKTGNRMNVGTMRGGAQAFKLDTLLKLSDVKGTDGKTTLLHFVVQEIIRAEGVRAAGMAQQSSSDTTGKEMSSENEEDYYRTLGLQVLINLSNDLYNVKNAATIDSDALISSLSKLVMGLNKLRSFLQKEFGSQPTETSRQQGNFCQSMTLFLHQAEEEISQIQSEEKRVFSLVKDLTKYFHGDAAKEEAHPLRIFVIVRDFTHMLDQVCKEVGKMQKQKPLISSQKGSSSISVQNLPRSLFPIAFDRNADISDDSSSE